MKLAIFTDSPLFVLENGTYGLSTPSFCNEALINRYFSFASEIEICSRIRESVPNTMYRLTLPNVKVTGCYNLSTVSGQLHRRKVRDDIKGVVERCDGAVIRLPSNIGEIAAKYCQKMNKPYLVEMVGCVWDILWNHSWKGKVVAFPSFVTTKSSIKSAPAVIYVTKKFLQHRYPTDGISIGCSDVSLQKIDEKVLMRRLQKIEKHTGRLIIGTTSAVNVRYKGQQYVIEALGKLKKQGNTSFEYQLVGGGDHHYLTQVAKKYGVIEQVKFLGQLSHESVFEWLDSIDLYVQPSRTEGLPRALVEAMSRGLPAFATRIGGIPELLEDAFLFKKGNQEVENIINILMGFDMDTLVSCAKTNFEKAKEFETQTLHDRRDKFYKKYFLNIIKAGVHNVY